MRKPQLIDLYCGLGGWSEGALAAGYDVVGFDIERHLYAARELPKSTGTKATKVKLGAHREAGNARAGSFNYANECAPREAPLTGGWHEYPAQLVLQDILTIHGSQFRNAACIVASPPCTEYSYMAMPWSRGKQIAKALRRECEFPDDYTGSRTIAQLNALFDACFRIQREAIDATARDCPACGGKGFMVWYVNETHPCERCDGKGEVTRHIPLIVENVKGAQPWVGRAQWHYGSFYLWGDVPALMPFTARSFKTVGHANKRDGYDHTRHLTSQRESDAVKQAGLSGPAWFDHGAASHSSRSSARKAASAQIAKIPYALSSYIAEHYWPR